MDIAAYLACLGDTGPLAPEAATLRALHRAHRSAMPFENLDIALGRRHQTWPGSLFTQQRVCHRPRPEGRLASTTARGRRRLIATRAGRRVEHALAAAAISGGWAVRAGLALPAPLPQEPADER